MDELQEWLAMERLQDKEYRDTLMQQLRTPEEQVEWLEQQLAEPTIRKRR